MNPAKQKPDRQGGLPYLRASFCLPRRQGGSLDRGWGLISSRANTGGALTYARASAWFPQLKGH
jgi:hypothetical protein